MSVLLSTLINSLYAHDEEASLQKLIFVALKNIRDAPTVGKYRSMKLSNTSVARLFEDTTCAEIMQKVGWVRKEEAMVLPMEVQLQTLIEACASIETHMARSSPTHSSSSSSSSSSTTSTTTTAAASPAIPSYLINPSTGQTALHIVRTNVDVDHPTVLIISYLTLFFDF